MSFFLFSVKNGHFEHSKAMNKYRSRQFGKRIFDSRETNVSYKDCFGKIILCFVFSINDNIYIFFLLDFFKDTKILLDERLKKNFKDVVKSKKIIALPNNYLNKLFIHAGKQGVHTYIQSLNKYSNF